MIGLMSFSPCRGSEFTRKGILTQVYGLEEGIFHEVSLRISVSLLGAEQLPAH